MTKRRGPSPDVEITRESKRGEWHTIEGRTKDGQKTSIDIHAKNLENMSRVDRDALVRRSLFGQAREEQKR